MEFTLWTVNAVYHKKPRMAQQTVGIYVNPSEEAIRLGALTVRFLITGENSKGSIAAFEVMVPSGQRLAAPALSHDHYEETIYGISGGRDRSV